MGAITIKLRTLLIDILLYAGNGRPISVKSNPYKVLTPTDDDGAEDDAALSDNED